MICEQTDQLTEFATSNHAFIHSLSETAQSLLRKLSTKSSILPRHLPFDSTAQCRRIATTPQHIHPSSQEEIRLLQPQVNRRYIAMPHDESPPKNGTKKISSDQRSSITSDYITDVEMD